MPILQNAATVLIIRDHSNEGIQVLLLKRNRKLKFAPQYWVFPGGRIDSQDGSTKESHMEQTAKNAAVREAFEEAKITLDPDKLIHFCHWTTPVGNVRRFATWFFHAQLDEQSGDVVVDDGEIVDHLWINPRKALRYMSGGMLSLLPPTFINLERIKYATSYQDVAMEFNRTGIIKAAPVTKTMDGLFYCLYKGDAGYTTCDIALREARHRLIIDPKKGQYQFEYKGCDHPSVCGGVEMGLNL